MLSKEQEAQPPLTDPAPKPKKDPWAKRREEDKVLLANLTATQPPANDTPKGAEKVRRLWQHLQRNEEEKKHSASRRRTSPRRCSWDRGGTRSIGIGRL